MISFANMKMKPVNTTHEFEWNGIKIEVLDYLPIEDKYDLIMITLQKAFENGYYNPILIDKYFHLNLVYLYTNINFTDKQKEDESKLYDILKSNGLMDAIIANIDEETYNELYVWMDEVKREITDYNKSAAGVIKGIIADMPAQAEAMKNILDNFDPEKYQEVINFAKAANGGREIQG